MTSDENAWYRQIGIVDQNGVASLDKTIDGDDDGIVVASHVRPTRCIQIRKRRQNKQRPRRA